MAKGEDGQMGDPATARPKRASRKTSAKAGEAAVQEPASAKRRATPAAKTQRAGSGRRSAKADGVPAAKKAAKGAVRSSVAKARRVVDEAPTPSLHVPSLPHVEVGQTVKAIGSQILGALNTDVGRVMVAELLVYVAKSLTTAAAETEAGKDTKTALLNAGAKIGAAAADAGARMVDTGAASAAAGAHLVGQGASAAASGAHAAAETAGQAQDLVREVAHVAVGVVGGVVADAAQKMMKRRKQTPSEAPKPDRMSRPPVL